jgi:hypothetical protein
MYVNINFILIFLLMFLDVFLKYLLSLAIVLRRPFHFKNIIFNYSENFSFFPHVDFLLCGISLQVLRRNFASILVADISLDLIYALYNSPALTWSVLRPFRVRMDAMWNYSLPSGPFSMRKFIPLGHPSPDIQGTHPSV